MVGIEPYERITSMINLEFIKNELEKSNWAISNKKEWKKMALIFDKIINEENPISIEEFDYLFFELNKIIDSNTPIFFEDNFFTQMLENLITYLKLNFTTKLFNNEDEKLAYAVGVRDLQMANNLIYFKNRNPNAKIIVWLANFHGATNLREVLFAEGDPSMYSKFTVFGEHIKNKYSNKVYSLAITSSKGFSKMPYNNKNIKETKIISPKESLEYELDKQNCSFGFIDFNEIYRNHPQKKEKKFNSIMLGHVNQNGKWLKVFDGLFYIRENEIAIPK